MFVWFPVFLSRWSKMIGYDNLICNVVWCYGYCLQAYLLSLFLCLKAYSFFMTTLRDAQTKIAIVYMQEQSLWHKRWYDDTNMIWYVCNGWCRSLMCTSNVAGNTQMASLDRQVTQNGLEVNNVMARMYNEGIPWYQGDMEVTVLAYS